MTECALWSSTIELSKAAAEDDPGTLVFLTTYGTPEEVAVATPHMPTLLTLRAMESELWPFNVRFKDDNPIALICLTAYKALEEVAIAALRMPTLLELPEMESALWPFVV